MRIAKKYQTENTNSDFDNQKVAIKKRSRKWISVPLTLRICCPFCCRVTRKIFKLDLHNPASSPAVSTLFQFYQIFTCIMFLNCWGSQRGSRVQFFEKVSAFRLILRVAASQIHVRETKAEKKKKANLGFEPRSQESKSLALEMCANHYVG